MITIDSREKKISHIIGCFEKWQIPYQIQKLDFGDYSNDANARIIVDRKQNLIEVAQNLCSKDNRRFWNEIRGAYKAGIKMVILCEHGGQIRSVRDVASWKNPYSNFANGSWLMAEMFNIQMAYGVEWRFCDKRTTAKEILKVLAYRPIETRKI